MPKPTVKKPTKSKRSAANSLEKICDMHVVAFELSKLKPYERNPRKNDQAVGRMVASIKEFGFKVPILAKSDGTVIDGHLRLKAAIKLCMNEVPVVLCDEW